MISIAKKIPTAQMIREVWFFERIDDRIVPYPVGFLRLQVQSVQDLSLDKIQDHRSENDQEGLQNVTMLLRYQLCDIFPVHRWYGCVRGCMTIFCVDLIAAIVTIELVFGE